MSGSRLPRVVWQFTAGENGRDRLRIVEYPDFDDDHGEPISRFALEKCQGSDRMDKPVWVDADYKSFTSYDLRRIVTSLGYLALQLVGRGYDALPIISRTY